MKAKVARLGKNKIGKKDGLISSVSELKLSCKERYVGTHAWLLVR